MERLADASAHRLDEFSAGYSSAGQLSSIARFRFTSRRLLGTSCNAMSFLPVEYFSSNGQLCLNCFRSPESRGKRKQYRHVLFMRDIEEMNSRETADSLGSCLSLR